MLIWNVQPENNRQYQEFFLETERSIWKVQKIILFPNKKVKNSTPNLASTYVHCLFATVLIKQVFEKSKSLRAASGRRTQF